SSPTRERPPPTWRWVTALKRWWPRSSSPASRPPPGPCVRRPAATSRRVELPMEKPMVGLATIDGNCQSGIPLTHRHNTQERLPPRGEARIPSPGGVEQRRSHGSYPAVRVVGGSDGG